jgi:hypothetical protein
LHISALPDSPLQARKKIYQWICQPHFINLPGSFHKFARTISLILPGLFHSHFIISQNHFIICQDDFINLPGRFH